MADEASSEKAAAAAEKAYAAASETLGAEPAGKLVKSGPVKSGVAKAKAAPKPRAAPKAAKSAAEPVELPEIALPEIAVPQSTAVETPEVDDLPEPVAVDAIAVVSAAPADVSVAEAPIIAAPVAKAPAKSAPVKSAPAKSPFARTAAKPARVAAKPAPVKTPVVKTVKTKPLARVKQAAKVPAPAVTAVSGAITFKPTLTPAATLWPAIKKDLSVMATTDFTAKIQETLKDATEKSKALLEKSQSAFGDAGEFAKGNVEAVVESSKILASGLQEMGKSYMSESKSSFDTITADVKDLAASKSPTEFFEKQAALMRKNFDSAVAASSKSTEALLKLANEAFQPLSTRVSLAVEKIKLAA